MKLFYGPKGTGKTKLIIDEANKVNDNAKNCVAFITDTKRYMYDLNHSVRFLDVTDFNISGKDGLLGFIKGIVAANADLQYIFIDGFARMSCEEVDNLETEFIDLENLSAKYNINFVVSFTYDKTELPESLAKFDN